MANLKQKIAAERKVRALLAQENVQAPDRVEYGFACIRLFWEASKVVLVVDIEEFAEDLGNELLDLDLFPRDG